MFAAFAEAMGQPLWGEQWNAHSSCKNGRRLHLSKRWAPGTNTSCSVRRAHT